MDVGKQKPKGYDKKSHLAFLHGLVRDIPTGKDRTSKKFRELEVMTTPSSDDSDKKPQECDNKKEWPDENVCVDEETAEVVWEKKPSIPEKEVDSVGGYLDRRKKDYPWI